MDLIQSLLQEMDKEAVTTRKMLEQVPADKFDWQPHPRSMTLKRLSTHIAELPGWITMTMNTSELDFATSPYEPKDVKSNEELLAFFEENFKSGREALANATPEELKKEWILRNGDQILQRYDKHGVIRMVFSQIIHHRAQLGVFLRLLDIPIPEATAQALMSRTLNKRKNSLNPPHKRRVFC